jgi:hypothetical protein
MTAEDWTLAAIVGVSAAGLVWSLTAPALGLWGSLRAWWLRKRSTMRRITTGRGRTTPAGCECRYLSTKSLAAGRHCTWCHARRIGRCKCGR